MFMIFPMKGDGCESSARVIGFICPTSDKTQVNSYTWYIHSFFFLSLEVKRKKTQYILDLKLSCEIRNV